MASIENPILRGFNPDPSIVRVRDDFYIATSTFEWYPGVQIHHSKDLANWQLIARPLQRATQLNMLGNPDSCGVWAPCLSWHDGLFYLVYTDVKRLEGNFKDTHNYLVTSEQIDRNWSDPVYLNSSGFDPSLFHDDDGRKWLVNMIWDHRPGRSPFGGVVLQEYGHEEGRLTGPVYQIFTGSPLGCTEGPHLYKRNGWYYLLTAEGGTGPSHASTLARSTSLFGPYELHPEHHILTSKNTPEASLRRAGHGDIVELEDGSVYLVHLCSRPLEKAGSSPLGRETAIQKMVWDDDDWLRLDGPGLAPRSKIAAPALGQQSVPVKRSRCDFDQPTLPLEFQWLRSPWPEELFTLNKRPGHLRLIGGESLGSWFRQALVARRQQAFCFCAETVVEFEPENFQQMAGLVCYYNSQKYHYLYISHDKTVGKYLGIMSCLADLSWSVDFPLQNQMIPLQEGLPVYLRAEVAFEHLSFSWSMDGLHWNSVDKQLDMRLLSDEAGRGEDVNFTGTFVGVCAQDLSGTQKTADFDYFDYKEGG